MSVLSSDSGRSHDASWRTFPFEPTKSSLPASKAGSVRDASDGPSGESGSASDQAGDSAARTSIRSAKRNSSTVNQDGGTDLDLDAEDEPADKSPDERPVLEHSEMPKTATSDLSDFLRQTGPSASLSRSSFSHSGPTTQVLPGPHHFLWNEPPPTPKKRGILSRARTAVGLRRQRSEHNITFDQLSHKGPLSEGRQLEFDAQLLTDNVTKRVLPSGLSYYTLTSVETDASTSEARRASASAATGQTEPAPKRSRHRSKLSSGLSLPGSSSLKLRSIGGRSTSMSSFADPTVRPVSSHGKAVLSYTVSSPQHSDEPEAGRKSAPPGHGSGHRSGKSKSGRADFTTMPRYSTDVDAQTSGRVSIADMRGSKDKTHGSPAMSQISNFTAPPNAQVPAANSHGRAPSRAESRASIKTFMSMKNDFPGLLARAASAMSSTSAFQPCPSPVPPLPHRPAEYENEAAYHSAMASPTPSTVSGSMWQRNSAMFVPVTVGDVELGHAGNSDLHSTAPRDSAIHSLDILRPSDFAGPSGPEREHARSKSRGAASDSRSDVAGSSSLLLPPVPTNAKVGSTSMTRGRSREEPELRQGWIMPRDLDAVKAARSASALGFSQPSDHESEDSNEPMPQMAQRALSPPSRKRSGRSHSRTTSLESVGIIRSTLEAGGHSREGSSRRGSPKSKAAEVFPAIEGSATWDAATPIIRASPLRNTLALPDSSTPSTVRQGTTSAERRRSTGSKSRQRPTSVCSSKSGADSIASGSASITGTGSKRGSRLLTLSLSQISPSASLEVDTTRTGKFGLGLRTGSVLVNAFADQVSETSARSRNASDEVDLVDANTSDAPCEVGHMSKTGSKDGGGGGGVVVEEDDVSVLNPTSPAAMLWGALEAIRAEFMISELRAEQERARFRLLARRSADVLESTQTALSAARASLRRSGPGKRRGRASGCAGAESGVRKASTTSSALLKAKQERARQQRERKAREQGALETVLAELRVYGALTSPRGSTAGSTSVTDSLAARKRHGRVHSNATSEWADVSSDEVDDTARATSRASALGSALDLVDQSRTVVDDCVTTNGAEYEEEDDISSHRTDNSVDMSRETMSQATTLDDVTTSTTAESPMSKIVHRGFSQFEEHSETLDQRGDTSTEGDTFASFRFSDSPMSPGTFGNLSEIAGPPRPKARLGSHAKREHSPDSDDGLPTGTGLAAGVSPVLMQSPRSFGTISEDSSYELDGGEDSNDVPLSYDENGPFGSHASGVLYSLRSASNVVVPRRGMSHLSISRQRRCESLSTIASEDVASEWGPSSSDTGFDVSGDAPVLSSPMVGSGRPSAVPRHHRRGSSGGGPGPAAPSASFVARSGLGGTTTVSHPPSPCLSSNLDGSTEVIRKRSSLTSRPHTSPAAPSLRASQGGRTAKHEDAKVHEGGSAPGRERASRSRIVSGTGSFLDDLDVL